MRNVHRLIQIVIMATDGFVRVAEQVAEENPDFQVLHIFFIIILILSTY